MTSLAVMIVPPVAVMMADASDEPSRRLRASARHPKPAIGARGCPRSLAVMVWLVTKGRGLIVDQARWSGD